jgi:hypothetical protein
MTRSTEVIVTSPGIDPMDMWRVMATLIVAPEQYRFEVTSQGISAHLNQGLCALMSLDHAVGRVLIPEGGCDKWCEPDCSATWCWAPAHYLKADFDTAYSYTGSCGCHSGGLHICLVSGLGEWLDQQGATWLWRDESGDAWRHDDTWGSLGDPREACPTHRAIPAPHNPHAADMAASTKDT